MAYNFDNDLDIFISEPFAQEVEYSGGTKLGILDMPDEIIAGDMVISTDYLLTVKTSDFSSVSLGDTVTTNLSGSSTAFEVRTKRMIDDGTFSQITLSKT